MPSAALPVPAPCAASFARAAPLRRRLRHRLRTHARSDGSGDGGGAEAASPPASPADGLARLRASLGGPGGLPCLCDASLVAEDVAYDGPLASLRGRDAYVAAQREWAAALPSRLQGYTVGEPALFALSPQALRLRYAPRFGARPPPQAAERLAAAGEPPLPLRADGLLEASLSVAAELTLDERGRVTRHTERIQDGYDVAATVARYEWLTARRRADPPPLWYYKVLRATSLEEAAAAAGTTPDDDSLQAGFSAMVARNFGAGLLLGVAIYAGIKALRYALAVAAAAPPQL